MNTLKETNAKQKGFNKMKTYDLYFVRGDNLYVFNTREDALVRVIVTELKDGAILTCIKEAKQNE